MHAILLGSDSDNLKSKIFLHNNCLRSLCVYNVFVNLKYKNETILDGKRL